MSVINKMLRDLDARRTEGATPELARAPAAGLMQGTAAIPGPAPASDGRRRWGLLLLSVLLLGGVVTLAAYWPAAQPVSAPPVAAVTPVVVPEPSPAALQEPTVLQLELTREPPALPAVEPSAVLRQDEAPPVPAAASEATTSVSAPAPAGRGAERSPAPAAAERATPAPAPRQASRAATATPAPEPAAPPAARQPPAAPAAVAPAVTEPARRAQALQETLARAQALWQAGSRDVALELIREAVAVAERAPRSAGRDEALAALAREQARMELAQGRPAEALSLLIRLEPALQGQADLWAVRGNAAQRLARHPEAVQAYQRALQLRPGESRWLLGAAVSLAAMGRLEESAALAEQARAQGSVSPEVLGYLRQSGVPLR